MSILRYDLIMSILRYDLIMSISRYDLIMSILRYDLNSIWTENLFFNIFYPVNWTFRYFMGSLGVVWFTWWLGYIQIVYLLSSPHLPLPDSSWIFLRISCEQIRFLIVLWFKNVILRKLQVFMLLLLFI